MNSREVEDGDESRAGVHPGSPWPRAPHSSLKVSLQPREVGPQGYPHPTDEDTRLFKWQWWDPNQPL